MSKFDRLIDNKLIQNLFVWLFFYVILLITIQDGARALTSIYVILLLAPAVYINNLYILPFFRKKPSIFFLLFSANSIVFTAISVYLIVKNTTGETLQLGMFVNFLGIMILALLFASSLKIARDSFTRRQQEKDAELKLLKGQLNPHFLFNTLNNLYGLSVIKSDKLPELMLKLSDLLRYSLYETKDVYVPLEKEIQYLENYISLEKIRLEEKTDILFSKTGEISTQKIAPMLFIVFVENAFKHLETSTDIKENVSVSIRQENNKLYFKCQNTIGKMDVLHENLEKGKNGIGLQNVKKRLALMYPDQHTLTIEKKEGIYSVNLILEV
ncbi:hypothetical protein GCM10011344_11400 [Dokdonia pacifica]|uniref:GHKL domain-containing protein n=1 Tax=Dokdonia pacifica TaxID=1627892 RepID=A0A238YGR8_9FLAO|nr:histidine kinase [Dokdonia pacifica]GGG12454.1 hypothetical protein GCM10011344_11400 [Dokdonia pacifica]SNR70270.1 GHKL domain-containing protein [Dokdonia pacifica]